MKVPATVNLQLKEAASQCYQSSERNLSSEVETKTLCNFHFPKMSSIFYKYRQSMGLAGLNYPIELIYGRASGISHEGLE